MSATITRIPEWREAQKSEQDFWDGLIGEDHALLKVLADNAERASLARKCLSSTPEKCLEVGIGPLGIGISGFLPEIPVRIALDPLPPLPVGSRGDYTTASNEQLRGYVREQQAPIRYIVACGEEIPIRNASVDFAICCNVIDHASDPAGILREIHRVLKPEGLFFFDVDTFSVLGLAKWHSWTKRIYRDLIMVKAHPHRMSEANVVRKLRSAGFQLRRLYGHTLRSNLVGHARKSTFLGTKCSP